MSRRIPEAWHACCGQALETSGCGSGNLSGGIRLGIGSTVVEGSRVTDPVSTDAARAILNDLIRQRQRMQGTDCDRSLLEANRLAIVFWQQELRRAIEAKHGRARAAS
jgi:hypothetical protein